jgi:hypothetical protein
MGLLADWGGDGAMLWTCCLAGAVGGVVWAVMEWRTVIIEPANDPLEAALP